MTRRKTISLLTIAAILTALAGMTVAARERPKSDSFTAVQDVTLVTTEEGAVRGVAAKNHREFLGVPYAAPPIGESRWKAPSLTHRGASRGTRPIFATSAPKALSSPVWPSIVRKTAST